jgi:hypothetical protein
MKNKKGPLKALFYFNLLAPSPSKLLSQGIQFLHQAGLAPGGLILMD